MNKFLFVLGFSILLSFSITIKPVYTLVNCIPNSPCTGNADCGTNSICGYCSGDGCHCIIDTTVTCNITYKCSDSNGGDNAYGAGDHLAPSKGYCDNGNGHCDWANPTDYCNPYGSPPTYCINGYSTCQTTTTTTTTTSTTTVPITTTTAPTITTTTTSSITSTIPTRLNYTLTDIGQGVGNLLMGMSPALTIFIILLAVGSMVGFIISSLFRKERIDSDGI